MFYPDQFGVDESGKPATFKTLINMLDYLKDLGVTTIYILPFADSPMGDSGFDVRDPKNVRADLAAWKSSASLWQLQDKRALKSKQTLSSTIFPTSMNGSSRRLKGDINKLHYFIAREDMPEYRQYKDEKQGYMVEYKEKDGTVNKKTSYIS